MRKLNLMSEVYGHLKVVAPAENIGRYTAWVCLCACGREVVKRQADLRSGAIKSCGCKKIERAVEMGRQNRRLVVAGERFGKLVVVGDATPSRFQDGRTMFRMAVRCDCGVEKVVPSQKLTASALVSCGCARRSGKPLLPRKRLARAAAAEHRRRALKVRAGGSFTAAQIEDLFKKQRGKCAWCAARLGDDFHRDHKVPIARGGSNFITNIELLCKTCNLKKHAKDPIDWAQQNGRLL
jgi:hypothetical protein